MHPATIALSLACTAALLLGCSHPATSISRKPLRTVLEEEFRDPSPLAGRQLILVYQEGEVVLEAYQWRAREREIAGRPQRISGFRRASPGSRRAGDPPDWLSFRRDVLLRAYVIALPGDVDPRARSLEGPLGVFLRFFPWF